MSPEFQDSIVNQTRSGAKPREIISSLRLDHDEEYPILKSRDVYNVKAKATSEALGSLTLIQALMRRLYVQEDWFFSLSNTSPVLLFVY